MSECRPVIFLNGPPRCGKDTLAEHIAKVLPGFTVVKFAHVLKEKTHALYGAPEIPHDFFEHCKDELSTFFLGVTPRQAYIAVSEKLLKPLHGEEIFGELLVNKMSTLNGRAFIISDSGFVSEANPVLKEYGAENCALIRIHAKGRGCSFRNDSRSYINLPCESFDIENNGTIDQFLKRGTWRLQCILQEMVGGQ